MKKIRINELARELEVKPGVILELLPELGVREKKTHSSSIDEDVAIVLRQRLTGSGVSTPERPEASNGHVHEAPTSDAHERMPEPAAETPAQSQAAEVSPVQEPVTPVRAGLQPPLRTSATTVAPIADREPSPPATATGATPLSSEISASGEAARAADAEHSIPKFQPLRPPLGGSAIHPPLAQPSSHPPATGPINRSISIPARPLPQATPRTGTSGAGMAATGPRQPLPAESARPPLGMPTRPVRPESHVEPSVPTQSSTSPQPSQPKSPQPPTHGRSGSELGFGIDDTWFAYPFASVAPAPGPDPWCAHCTPARWCKTARRPTCRATNGSAASRSG